MSIFIECYVYSFRNLANLIISLELNHKILFYIIVSLLLTACSTEEKEEVVIPFEMQDIPVNEKVKIALSEEYFKQIGIPDSTLSYLEKFYSSRNYSPKWINDSMLTKTGVQLKNRLPKSFSYGIPKGRVHFIQTENYIQDELNLTLALAQITYDLDSGIIDYENKIKKAKKFVSISTLDSLDFNSEDGIRIQLLNRGKKDSTYLALAQGLISLIDAYPIDTSTFNVESIKYDTLLAAEKTRTALVSKGYLNDSIRDSTLIITALQKFQIDNGLKPDGVIGKYTSKALNESTYHKVERILLAMDKIRSRQERPNKYIHINIPEYKLRYYINDSLKSDHNIVVGKIGNETPELTSKLRKIVVYPYWNVPYSISSKEILPHLKRDPGYLAKHNYTLLKKDEEIDPYSVDWSKVRQNSFRYKIRQGVGRKNSLGIIKFDFYNKHSVYFHDTPSKSLFGVDVRAYSHGCMRTQNPIDLAKVILGRDEYRNKVNEMTPDSLDTLLNRAENYEIKLLHPIPIFIEYQTVVRTGGKMQLYLDIYGRDEEYLEIMRE